MLMHSVIPSRSISQVTIDMDTFNSVRTFCSYSQLSVQRPANQQSAARLKTYLKQKQEHPE